jgi:allantoicase
MNEFTKLVDLASERLGGQVLAANDEFFAPKENLLKTAKPVFIEGKYVSTGKWMDGWESRRRRTPGHDWCVIRLGLAGIVRGVVVDTSYFTGNYPERFSLEGCDLGGAAPYAKEKQRLNATQTRWVQLLPETPLEGDKPNLVAVENAGRFTHLRLKIYPDGGVARLRVHGEVTPDVKRISRTECDFAAVGNGGSVIASSDEFYGSPLNMLMPGPRKNTGDGWETRRRRGPGHDWTIVKLGTPGVIRRAEVDTKHFKGNFPDSCSLESCFSESANASAIPEGDWKPLLQRTKLKADHRHAFRAQLLGDAGAATHVRFSIYPDGGISRLRLFGRAERTEERLKGIERFNNISRAAARKALLDCCGSKKWADAMVRQMPYASAEHLFEAAEKTWASLGHEDWLEAFRQHPPIGGKVARASAKQSGKATKWAAGEQSTAQKGTTETLAMLAAANRAYEAAFGRIFLICATGKSSEEILRSLQQRLSNDPEIELRVAAEEQRKITRLRLEKLLAL